MIGARRHPDSFSELLSELSTIIQRRRPDLVGTPTVLLPRFLNVGEKREPTPMECEAVCDFGALITVLCNFGPDRSLETITSLASGRLRTKEFLRDIVREILVAQLPGSRGLTRDFSRLSN